MKKPYMILKEKLSSKNNVQIKLLGDSITHGVGGTGFLQNGYSFVKGFARNPDGYCWSNKFKKYMEEKYDCSVIINACTGTDIQFIMSNFGKLVDKEDDLFICTIGTNNRHFSFDQGDKPTREEHGTLFYNNVIKLYNMFKESGKDAIFVANIPASSANEQDGDGYWRILHMDDINAIYKKACEKLDFPFISFYDLFTDYCESNGVTVDSLLCDGLHPNDRGYDVMFDLIVKELQC